ncbi:hypothetical protein JNG37_00360 [Streptococcus suis]|uniref:Capsular polysaccharide biosynthesis protein CpsC n=1 Tax=Streptococcus suis TaxID=1307 RepID=A0A4T2GPP1_STRSU|nr:hypothetical protein [Streptococcus suis]MBM7268942.1 hypothetical protein [Streptococcus suis]MBM7269344.1 hypothetical protein [Streptococcus suis]TII00121.1 hypothetical protein FAJ39_03340 [Streptococcus suis]TII00983.1 hypothetical protein FAJ39_01250 [Streptococcus suis]
MNQQNAELIDIFDLLKIIRKNIVFLLFSIIFCSGLSVLYARMFVPAEYQSEAQILVTQAQADSSNQIGTIKANIDMIPTYRDILYGIPVLGPVADKSEGRYSVSELQKHLTFKQSENSQAFSIAIRLDSAKSAQETLANITNQFTDILTEIYGENINKIVILSPASFQDKKVAPSMVRFVILGAVVGMTLSSLFLVVRRLMDHTISNHDYLEAEGLTLMTELYSLKDKEVSSTYFIRDAKRN